ncbi:sigma-E processing peptidase SpoIIGA [Brevibacillus sp. SYP-B805]|uniref:sigma-E processing peptidase SpoIIGA n=1 Tax=Brevibacillus sp. SYP-B805 TaxID=1578199 RepID=UPI0013E9FA27|nr:sigma-E processing peptidase SpoIIGA [Brevibacillus sp. SYP-B805]NGQ93728.1 sigma-E processing peptidase SpoIIGA [Brevibacillus sp. SYP-B805]
MVIYLDIILLLNLAIDTLLLWFTAYFRKERVVWWRILAAALVGSAYTLFFFVPSLAFIYEWFAKLLFSILMLGIAFGFRRWLTFLQNLCIFYFVGFLFGGGVFALAYFFTTNSEVVNGILVTHDSGVGADAKATFLLLAAGFAAVIIISRRGYHAIQEPRRIAAFLVDVEVMLAGTTVACTGLVDTGNQLHEPLSRTPVMVMESGLFGSLLPPVLLEIVQGGEGKLEKMEGLLAALPDEWQGRLRLIPYRSVSRGMDFLVAVKPDAVAVSQNGRRYQTTKALIGLNPIALAADGKYQAIVHPALMQTAAEDPVKSREQEG